MLSAELQSVTIRINGYFANGHLGSEIKTYIEAFNYAFDTLFKANGFSRCTPKEIKSIEGLAKKIKQYKRTYILFY